MGEGHNKNLTVCLRPADGNNSVMGNSRCVVCSPPLGHHPGHNAGAAGVGHSNTSHVEGTHTSSAYILMLINYPRLN